MDPGIIAAGKLADRKSTRLNSSHLVISYAVVLHLRSFPTRRASDLLVRRCADATNPASFRTKLMLGPGQCWGFLSAHCPGVIQRVQMGPLSRRHPTSSNGSWDHRGRETGRSEEHTSELQSPCNIVRCRSPSPLFPYPTRFRSPGPQVRRCNQSGIIPNETDAWPRPMLGVFVGPLSRRHPTSSNGPIVPASSNEFKWILGSSRQGNWQIGRAHV